MTAGMKPYYQDDTVTVYGGDCLDVLPALASGSVDLIAADPPYHRVKGDAWDRQWSSDAGYLAWLARVRDEWHRLLKPNGSLYCFAGPRMAALVEVLIAERFEVLNSIRWQKDAGWAKRACKEEQRTFFPASETIVFAEHRGADGYARGEAGYDAKCDELRGFVFEPLRAYLDGERRRAGVGKDECNEACGFSRCAGGMASRHYFSRSQWCLPTREHYESMQRLFNRSGGDYLRREYEDLRREYEDLRRPFSVSVDVPYTDVWAFPTVVSYKGKHPCEKPLAMMEHIVTASSRPGAVVLDCFAGSGTTLLAAKRLGRKAIGVELSEEYCEVIARRLEKELPGQAESRVAAPRRQECLPLFDGLAK